MYALTRSAVMAGLLIAVRFAFWAVSARVTGIVMDRVGRRPGLLFGYLALAVASLTDGVSIGLHLPWMLVLSGVLFGSGDGAASLGRAAVADMYAPQERARALGRLITAGTIGSVGGPLMIDALETFGGGAKPGLVSLPWLLLSLLAAGAFLLVFTMRPDPRELAWHVAQDRAHGSRSLRTLLGLPAARAAIAVAGAGWLAMVALMSNVPLAMRANGRSMLPMAVVLSLHFGARFAFSADWGSLATRRGFRRALVLACLLMVVGSVMTMWSGNIVMAGVGLFLVGLGWSGTYVGSTAAITELTRVGERAGTLGFNDLVGAGAAAVGALFGGMLMQRGGSLAEGFIMALVLVPALLLLVSLRRDAWTSAIARAEGA
ncbi:MAG: MFS transporter [Candidatus Dormibacteria bacterium]